MKQIVFYSWQSDLPNPCNRGLIQEALETAVASIAADETVTVEPVVDRDTQGVSGTPDISSTIFSKITAADVFVADISIIGRAEKRATPNPNVLIELGYAFKAVGDKRIITIFNLAFGKIEDLPFDLRMRRVLTYDMPLAAKPRSSERKSLEKTLEVALRAALALGAVSREIQPIPSVQAIENQQSNRVLVLRRNLQVIFKKLENLQPKMAREGGSVDELIAALDRTQEVVAEFSKIVEVVAAMGDLDAATEIQNWFGYVFQQYSLPRDFSGSFSEKDQDYFKFLGHEMFVTFVAFLLKEKRWEMLGTLSNEPIPVKYLRRDHGAGNVDWRFASEHLLSLLEKGRRESRMSPHADLLNYRHTSGGLAAIMPMEEFMEADYFLFLLGEMAAENVANSYFEWRPWSALYLKRTPLFLRDAEYRKNANRIMKLFQIESAEEFRKRLAERASRLGRLFSSGFWENPLRPEVISKFGTR